MSRPKIASKGRQRMESEVYGTQKIQGRLIIQLQRAWYNQMFRYFAITLEAFDVIWLMFSSNF
jgi:hypothetical protein